MADITNIDVVKVLLKHIGHDLEDDIKLAVCSVFLLEHGWASEPEPKADAADKQQNAAIKQHEKSAPKKRRPFDTGKMKALLDGGWTVSKIADEMGVSEPTIYAHMKKEGITK